MRRMLASALCALLSNGLAAQERMLTVPPNVTIDGVPPIPMRLVEAVAPYGQFRQARLVAWHPAERRIVIVTSFGNVPQLHQVAFPGGARTQLTFFGDGVPPRPGAVFGPTGDFLVFQKDTAGGGEANQLFRYDFGTGRVTLLTDGKSRNGSPTISRSGLIAYESTRRNGKDFDLHVVRPGDPSSDRRLAEFEGSWSALAWSRDETAILALQSLSSADTQLWRIQVPGGEQTRLSPDTDRPVRWLGAAFGADGRTVYAAGNLESETARVWRFKDGKWSPVTPADQVIESFAMAPDGGRFAVAVDTGSASRLQIHEPSGRVAAAPLVPPGVISDIRWHPARSELGFNHAGARAFSDVYSVNLSNGRPERWTFSEMAAGGTGMLPDARVVSWKSFDGLEIPGVLYPAAARFTGPRPVIINVHGGPAERERPRNLGRSNYFRNELGITVIYPNIRGSSGYGRTFEELDNGRLRENAVRDIGALLDWIATQPDLDSRRVMIAGASYGGFVALASAIAYGDRFRGVNPAFCITDFPSYLESTDVSRQADRNAEYGDPSDPEMRAFLTRISPLTNVAKLRMPVFLAAGAKDTRVPVSQAERLVQALKANGTPVWYVRFEDAGHLQLTAATNDFSIYTWVMFVRQYLLS